MVSRTAFLCALAASFIALTGNEVTAHSWADCVDWRPMNGATDSKSISFAANKGRCYGWARRFPVHSKFAFGHLDDADPNRHYDQGLLKMGNPACSDGKHGTEKGSDETIPTSKNPAYGGSKWGTQASAKPGQQMCIRWPAKNHAKENPVNNVSINFMKKPTPNKDPSQKDLLNKANIFNIPTLPYAKMCSPNKNGDFTPCGGCFNVPENITPGTYLVQWRWLLNSDEFYTSCWDLVIEGGDSKGGNPPKPKAKNSLSNDSNVFSELV
ncbi:hypothetical protein B0O80DRAFT_421521 [Mortierella sp. GBAus27b]|nr:hypothetical protein BGX31_000162 [Mortierella sp. GBA43]KAI8361913.1 hypothetical protein B0O80DRAFT_421521 [Mortierella sp. GBAus27b]